MREPDDVARFENMLGETDRPFCWCCGRSDRERPEWWHAAPWVIERAHIVSQPRAKDRRACILACSACHKGSIHGEKFPAWDLPRLGLHHLLWIKRHRDREFYDRKFLRRHSVRVIPACVVPPMAFLHAYESRRRN